MTRLERASWIAFSVMVCMLAGLAMYAWLSA
jgi:hypothetical protein